jgi:hypothetical protein
MTKQKHVAERLGDDLLRGAREIGAFLNLTEAEARWHIDKGHIPTTRMGKIYIGRKSELIKHFSASAAAA